MKKLLLLTLTLAGLCIGQTVIKSIDLEDGMQLVYPRLAESSDLATKADAVGTQFLTVTATTNQSDNGTALLAAYVTAEGMSPAAGNEVTLILPPATYDLGAGTLNMTSEYINIVGQIPCTISTLGPVPISGTALVGSSAVLTGEKPKSIITSSGLTINSTVAHGQMLYLKIDGAVNTAGDKAQVWQDIWFSGAVDLNNSTSNTFIRCNAPVGLCATDDYGGNNNFLGVLENCTISGDYCVGGYSGVMSGTITGSTISGYRCVGGYGGAMSGMKLSYSTLLGPNQMANATYSTNTIISYCTGIPTAVTSKVARVKFCIDENNNVIPNQ